MKVVFGSIITEGHGKMGGAIVQQSYGGYQMRNLKQPLKFPTLRQSVNRVGWAYITRSWSGLSTLERDSWNSAASPGQSGFELYTTTNMAMFNTDLPLISTYQPPVSPPVNDLYLDTSAFDYTPGAKKYTASYKSTGSNIPSADWSMYIQWTGWINASVSRYPPIKLRVPIASLFVLNNTDYIFRLRENMGFNFTSFESGSHALFNVGLINNTTGQIFNYLTEEAVSP